MSWTSSDLKALLDGLRLRRGDSTSVEVKLASGDVPSMSETLCAFGNMPAGGTIILGVDEHAGFAIVGVTDVAVMEAGVASQARTAVNPPVHVDFDDINVDGKNVVVVTVAGLPPAAKPCRSSGKAYLRQADGDYVMSDPEIEQLAANRGRPRYDAIVVAGSSVDDLDADLVREFAADVRSSSRRLHYASDDEVMGRRRVITPEGLTVAGLYALGSYPQQFTPSLAVTAGAAGSGPGQRLADLTHMDGPVPDLLEQSIEWVRRNTRTAVVFDRDGNGRDQPEIPTVAVRELVANALVHRDLSSSSQSKRVEIRLLRDRLVITSPGGLWGISRDQLGTLRGKSAVNEFLYDMGRSVRTHDGRRVIEAEGGGIREARQALRDAGLPDPVFIDTGVSFSVIIYRQSVRGDEVAHGVESALPPTSSVEVALSQRSSSITSLMAELGLTRRQVKYALDRLVRMGRVVVDGGQGNRFTTYRLSS